MTASSVSQAKSDFRDQDKSGYLIVIEGASDGIGKTTQFKLLKQHLKDDGFRIATHHFPTYYSYQGEPVTKYLSGEFGSPTELSPYFVNSLYAHDRAITWRIKLKSEYEKGKTILLDRYTTSSLMYQSALFESEAKKRAFLNYVEDFEYEKLGIKRPNMVIFLYAPLKLITKMRKNRVENEGVAHDIHERNLAYMKKVYENAMFVAKHCGWVMINCSKNRGTEMRTPEEIHAEIYRKVIKNAKS